MRAVVESVAADSRFRVSVYCPENTSFRGVTREFTSNHEARLYQKALSDLILSAYEMGKEAFLYSKDE
jgi:hypothetical protein